MARVGHSSCLASSSIELYPLWKFLPWGKF
ncbi:unnamed protein product [Spirodela intermedia]|uniref:Uncharacterized protein n=1 Tax=Spirodela intermedia TaxID=51605 RepID=A0A7I8KB21_SPIIN|nr:unnamed protein product [Spirodela intermedia]